MNNTRALSTDKTSTQNVAGLPNAGSKLLVSNSVLHFDRTEPGDDSFLTLRITPPHPNALVVVSIDDDSLFQVAAGVERLAFKQMLTFKPEPTGSYVHLRYTPERSGRHQATLTVEAPATTETISVSLSGRASRMALPGSSLSLPAGRVTRRPMNALTKALVVGGLLAGIGYAGYAYRCQIWPENCSPFASTPAAVTTEESVTKTSAAPETPLRETSPEPAETRTKTTASERTQTTKRPTESITRRVESQRNVPDEAPAVRSQPAEDVPTQKPEARNESSVGVSDRAVGPQAPSESKTRKSTAAAKSTTQQRTQPVVPAKAAKKPNPSEESELERMLNQNN